MEIKVPEVGESVHEALLAKWFKKNGDVVQKDEPVCELETDKITLDVHAEASGTLSISVEEGATIKTGSVIGQISPLSAGSDTPPSSEPKAVTPPQEEQIKATVSSPAVRREMREGGIAPDSITGTGKGGRITLDDLFSRIEEHSRRPVEPRMEEDSTPSPSAVSVSAKPSAPELSPPAVTPVQEAEKSAPAAPPAASVPVTPVPPAPFPPQSPVAASVRTEAPPAYVSGREERVAMSPIRRRIAERLLAARQQTAMLTTFNEADLSHVKTLRENFREHFRQKYGTALGLMPFFVKACVAALKEFPAVNASIDGTDIVYHHFYDIGIAIGAEKGLVVPVLRNADQMKMYEIDQKIAELSDKIKTNRLAISDLEGGTFSISNGGVYGSMLSTPILNPPQSAVLGMHAIQDRPVVRDGQIVIRPMMYLALSYDHRIIDGREAVQFLKKVRDYIEAPEELLLEG
ncbi:dihydrolipoyllysine-residue succinyltransferase [Pelotalea chapellei]|uniref:Dihydrolipoyllysine-residue succinyltransferase component of 2-oxoglutarate dehydrogenase complex n=1 Tax=Pelotalea chapellei TaxID=44671 RepID=A0ABS5U406_9BACT|nr:dihydrolipoyllysine-residue succinyltransferase [Pelotalea chapellei]MBT1070400.1 dihydrolipoyllysine-residue succinyltransferase [Pelotalea chapellei]